jgi:multidrug resistance efflux pump
MALSSNVQGFIIYLGADNRDVITKGQVITHLDDSDLKAVFSRSEAQLESARSEENRQTKIVTLQIKEASERIAQAEDTFSAILLCCLVSFVRKYIIQEVGLR